MTVGSRTPVETIKAIYAAIGVGDLDAAISLLDPGIVVQQSSALPFAGEWRGHDGFRAMGAAIYEAWPDFSVKPEQFLSDGKTVLVVTRVRGANTTAMPLDQPMIERWRVAGGKAVECQPFYFDPAAAAATVSQGD